MNPLIPVIVALLIAGAIGFLYVTWTARSLTGSTWLPHLALAWLFVPVALVAVVNLALVNWNEPGPERETISRLFLAGVDFCRYALLALMLYLIARRLPGKARRDESVEGGD